VNVCPDFVQVRRRWWCVFVAVVVSLAVGGTSSAQSAGGGAGHTVILKSDGTVWTVGDNASGQIGDDNSPTDRKHPPYQVSGLTDIIAVAVGGSHTLALTSTGNVYGWGLNTSGQVGIGNTTSPQETPQQLSLSNIVAIAAGATHSVALDSSGNAYTWGKDDKGQIGDSTNGTSNKVSPWTALTGVAAIAAGQEFTLFVKTDGTVYGTGENTNYQLGTGINNSDQTAPVQMSGITTAIAAAGGERHSIILLSGGTVKAVGEGESGALGTGSTSDATTPVSVSTLTNITAIAAGADHTLARESDGTVWAWGANFYGQVGNDNKPTNATSPVELTSLSSITKIGAGREHSIAVSSSGVVYTFGQNFNYELGDGTNVDRYVPTPISDAGYDWKVSTPTFNVAAGTYSTTKTVTMAVTTPATVTIHYTLDGNEPTTSDSSGTSVEITVSQTLKAKAFKSGMPASNTTTAAYELKVATPTTSPNSGTFSTAQSLTMSTTSPGATLRYTTDGVNTPTESSTAYTAALNVATSTTFKIRGFKTGWTTSDEKQTVITMRFGTLADPSATPGTGSYVDSVTPALSAMSGARIRYTLDGTTPDESDPDHVVTPVPAIQITDTLKAKAFHNDYYPSGVTTWIYTVSAAAPVFNPTAGTYVAGQQVTVTAPSSGSTIHYTLHGAEPTEGDPTIASGASLVVGNYTLKAKAWKTGASASATASAAYGVTGDVTPPMMAAGAQYSLAIRNDGLAWGWGNNSHGQTGDGTQTSPRLLPRIVSGITGAVAADGGEIHSHLVMNDGTVRGFGSGSSGRLGDGATNLVLLPAVISGLSAVVAVADGDDHAIALKGDGTVLGFGANTNGQVGDGTTTQKLTPTAISGLANITAVAAGDRFSLARKSDGTVWSWGRNTTGQLGDGTETNRSAPVEVDDVTTAVAVAAGWQHALALLADGTVVAWGDNQHGALGDGTTTTATSPVAVAGLDDVIAVGAGLGLSVALKDDGTVWTWGLNAYGQLGDGTTTDRYSPAQVSGLSDIVKIAVGDYHVLALASDLTVYAWGRNSSGQLGDGTTIDRWSPVAISGPGMSWRVATPTLSVASGLYYADQSVTVTIADPEATLRYTTTGVDPTSSDAAVTSGNAITVTQSQTLKVSGWKTGAPTSVVVARSYELKAVTPSLSPGAGAYGSPQTVSITTTTSGATLRYTTDGAEPTTSSTPYTGTFSAAETMTVKARAYKTGWTASDSGHVSYSISGGTVATPTITPAGGAQAAPPTIAIATATSGATLRYTLDGSTPTLASPVYLYPFRVFATTTVKAKAFKPGYTASAVATTTYDVDAAGATATPSIVPTGGRYATQQTVTISGASGATLRYTTDGSDPTTSSTSITSGNTLTVDKSMVVKVRAWASGSDPSAVRRADFLITGALSAGGLHSLAVASDGNLFSWGSDGFGQLANGAGGGTTVPVQVLTGVAAAAAGFTHTVIVKNDGTVWNAGAGAGHIPVQATNLTNAIAAAAGNGHTLVLKADGTVWGYGANGSGQLGNGDTTNQSTAVQVTGLTGIVAIAAGNQTSYALQTDGGSSGIVWAWGRNDLGQLGDGSTLERHTPTKVIGIGDAIAISAASGGGFAIALQADGRIAAWGHNDWGQLGQGDLVDRTTPALLPTLANRLVAAGGTFGLSIDASARTWGWGQSFGVAVGSSAGNGGGQLVVPQHSDFAEVHVLAAGNEHTLAGVADGTVRAAGANGGRLGNGGAPDNNTVVTVTGLTLADNTWLTTDADEDGLQTWREYLLGTDPLNADSNDNGVLDGHDALSGADPADADSDDDGVMNWTERQNGTDPFRADTDGDSVSDLNDAFPLDPTRSLPPSSNPSDTTPPLVTLKEPVSARPLP
jgi:alpha-tubulin suppressor-like RCC1 family protein